MKDLLLHPDTRQQLRDFGAAPGHALLLAGPGGSGKHTLAVNLSEQILSQPAGSFAGYPYKLVIEDSENKSIGIEAVRQLEHFLSLKVPSGAAHNRVVVIRDAQLLSAEAQNALLKTLEEPPSGTLIVMTTSHERALLPTIRSRVTTIAVKRPEKASAHAYFQALGFDSQAASQAYSISGGLAGLMQAMLEQSDHPLMVATEQVRLLLGQTVYERLLSVDELSKQRTLALDMVFILQQMARVSLETAAGPVAAKWQAVLNASYQASEALAANAYPKLALTNLMLSF